jgi:hypothetical protein
MRLVFVVMLAISGVGTAVVHAQEDVQLARVQVVDSEGVLVGHLVDSHPLLTVLLRAQGEIFVLNLRSKYEFHSLTSAVYFKTPDCTGPMYMLTGAGHPRLLTPVAVRDGFRVYFADPSAPGELVAARSTSAASGSCVEASHSEQLLRPAALLVDLTDRWKPPFRIR